MSKVTVTDDKGNSVKVDTETGKSEKVNSDSGRIPILSDLVEGTIGRVLPPYD